MRKRPLQFVNRALESSFLWAAGLTAAFYAIILQESMQGTWIRRYTTEHAVEYVITGFFVWGLVEIAFRLANYPREWRALEKLKLPATAPADAAGGAAAMSAYLDKQPDHLRSTRYGARLTKALSGLGGAATVTELREQLLHLSEQDEAAAHANYALVRFIVWLAPVLGFLGTVIHFGTALSGLSPDTIADQLSHIVGEMGTAFNTTTVALAASTTMMFALFLGERTERQLMKAIDDRVEAELLDRFQGMWSDRTFASFDRGEGSPQAVTVTAQTIVSQTLERFIEHTNALAMQHLNAWQADCAAQEARFAEQGKWLREASTHLANQATRLDTTAATLVRLLEEHGGLRVLQSGLSENLRQLHGTGQFDQAIHQLTAAVHLLTAKQRAFPMSDTRAA